LRCRKIRNGLEKQKRAKSQKAPGAGINLRARKKSGKRGEMGKMLPKHLQPENI